MRIRLSRLADRDRSTPARRRRPIRRSRSDRTAAVATSHSPRFGSYSTARVSAGRVERAERHAARLRRDAARLGLAQPEQVDIERLLVESARAAFGQGDGIVRIEWSHGTDGELNLSTIPRPLGDEPDCWRAADSKATHPGSEQRHNTKFVDVSAYDIAREEVKDSGLDEVLLYDAQGWLVEGGRSNFLVVNEKGQAAAPSPELGPVEGLGMTIVLENRSEIGLAKFDGGDVARARELLSINAVRGVVPIVELNGRPVGDGRPGAWAARLRPIFGAS